MNTMKKLILNGPIIDRDFIKLGNIGYLLSYYIDCYNYNIDNNPEMDGVFYRKREHIINDIGISIPAQIRYEKQLVEKQLLTIQSGDGKSNRIILNVDNINSLKQKLHTMEVTDKAKLKKLWKQLRHNIRNDNHNICNGAHNNSYDAHNIRNDNHNICNVNERISNEQRTGERTNEPTYEPLIMLSHRDIKNIQTLSSFATSSLYPHLSPEDLEYYKNYKL